MLSKEEIEEYIQYIKDVVALAKIIPDVRVQEKEIDVLINILQYIDQLKQENKRLTHTNKSYKGIVNKQNKIIDEMAVTLAGLALWDNEKEEPIILWDKEEVKQYFEKKVEEGNE